jgi:multiple sugar transport system substrate-binding protein
MGLLLLSVLSLTGAPALWSKGGQEQEAARGPVTIRFESWRYADPVSGDLYRRWMKEYEALNPNVTVQTEPVPYAQRIEKYTAEVLAGSPPDIAGLSSGDIVQFAGLGQVENLDAYYAKEGKAFRQSFTDASLALSQYKDSFYALTHEVVTADGIWYNVKYLAEAGLNPQVVTSSWTNYLNALKQMTTGGRFGLPLRGKDVTGTISAMWPYIMQKAGPLVLEEEVKSKLSSPEAKLVFKSYVELFTVHKVTPNPIEIDFTRQRDYFAQGQVAFMHQGSWLWSMVRDANPDMKGNYLPVPIPLFEGGKRFVTVDGMSMAIGKGSKNGQEAWKVMKFITTKEKQLENFKTSGFLPSHKDLIAHPDLQNDPVASMYLGQMASYGVPRPRSVKTNEFWSVIHEQFHNALLQKKTPEQALEDASRQINSEILK